MFTVPPFAWMIQPSRPAKQMVVMKIERYRYFCSLWGGVR